MAKIRVSTVRQMADVQVINVNARLVSKATRAAVMLHNVINNHTTTEVMPEHRLLYGVDEQANIEIVKTCEFALNFFDELVAAFEDDEKEDKKKD